MNKINIKLIIFNSKILSIIMFSLLIIPINVFATAGYIDNPTPYILSISPNSIENARKNIVITITGDGFIPSSIARANGSDRATTFIDYSHLLVTLNPNDTYNTDSIYINVFNEFPGGGYSNAKLFTIGAKTTGAISAVNTYGTVYPNTDQTENTITNENSANANYINKNKTDNKSSNLVSTAIFGTNSFLPSGLMQWILFAIIILLIIILVRRISGAEAKYNKAPMKTP